MTGIDPNITKPKAIVSLGKLYRGCRDSETRNRMGVDPLVKLLKDMGGWPMIEGEQWKSEGYSWYKHVAEANRNLYLEVMMNIEFVQNPDDSREYKILLERGQYLFAEYYSNILDDPESNTSQALLDSIVESARLLGSEMDTEKLREEAKKLIIFEYGLFMAGRDEDEDAAYLGTVGMLDANITDAFDRYPDFSYKEFFNLHLKSDVLVNDETSIYIQYPSHFIELPEFINKVDSRHVANYVSYWITNTFSAYTVKELWKLVFDDRRDWAGQKSCVGITKTFMSYALSRLYIDKYFTSLNRYHVNKMVEMIRLAYSSTLDQNLWMDKRTMLYSLVKLQSIESMIGYPEWILNDLLLDKYYEKVEDIKEDDYFGAIVQLCVLLGDAKYRSWNKTVGRNDTVRAATVTVNAYYLPRSNYMVLLTMEELAL